MSETTTETTPTVAERLAASGEMDKIDQQLRDRKVPHGHPDRVVLINRKLEHAKVRFAPEPAAHAGPSGFAERGLDIPHSGHRRSSRSNSGRPVRQ